MAMAEREQFSVWTGLGKISRMPILERGEGEKSYGNGES